VPEAARGGTAQASPNWDDIREKNRNLRQQSRFLCRRSDGLRDRSNDLLTVAMFRRQAIRLGRTAPHRHLVLVS
jgi:hypothetical protein